MADHEEETVRSNDSAQFRAFLSYSHADAGAARRLHWRLETYRLPRRLRGTAAGAEIERRLGPIFRDRDDLPAAADLSESVKQALAASDALIVLCSPQAKASPWVAREIALFRELHPGRPILAALIRGEPEQSFPAELTRGLDPLAADLRREGDGARLGFLKIVAGLANVPLDSLVQRDAQRRIRNVSVLSVGAMVAMIVMAGLTFVALDARDEARDRRAEAEGQIEYMLTDLRDDLRRSGRLDVMTRVNERAMAYYESQGDLTRLPADSLERRARVLHAMGEDDVSRGNLELARSRFEEALRATGELHSREPENPDRIFAHAQSEYWLGHVGYRNENWPTTRRRWAAYKALADQLLAIDPGDPRWLREAGYAEGNLCTLEQEQRGPRTPMLRHCRASLAHMQRVETLMPSDLQARQDVANRWAWLSTALQIAGDAPRADAAHRTTERIVRRLVEQYPSDANVQEQWARTLLGRAEMSHDFGRTEEAEAYRNRALEYARRLVELDPANQRWRNWVTEIANVQ